MLPIPRSGSAAGARTSTGQQFAWCEFAFAYDSRYHAES